MTSVEDTMDRHTGNNIDMDRCNITLYEIMDLDSFFSITVNEIMPNTRLLLIKVRSSHELDQLINKSNRYEHKIKAYYYIQVGNEKEQVYFSDRNPCYYIISKSKKISKHPIEEETDIVEMIDKLGDPSGRNARNGRFSREEERPSEEHSGTEHVRTELRGFIKAMQRNKLILDSEFVTVAHYIRCEDTDRLIMLNESIKRFRSDLDKLATVKKQYSSRRGSLVESSIRNNDNVFKILEDLAKIKLVSSKIPNEVRIAMETNSISRKKIVGVVSQFFNKQITIRELVSSFEGILRKKASPSSANQYNYNRKGFSNPIRIQSELVYDLRPQSPAPNKTTLSSFLKKRAGEYFSTDEISILNRLNKQKNQKLICCYELFLSDNDEAEFVETVKILLNIVKNKDKGARKPSSGGLESDGDDFKVYSVDTLTNGDSNVYNEDGNENKIERRETLPADTPIFNQQNMKAFRGNDSSDEDEEKDKIVVKKEINIFVPSLNTHDNSFNHEGRESAHFQHIDKFNNAEASEIKTNNPVPQTSVASSKIKEEEPNNPYYGNSERQRSQKSIQNIPETNKQNHNNAQNLANVSFCNRGNDRNLFMNNLGSGKQVQQPQESTKELKEPSNRDHKRELSHQATSEFKGFGGQEEDNDRNQVKVNVFNNGLGGTEFDPKESDSTSLPKFGNEVNEFSREPSQPVQTPVQQVDESPMQVAVTLPFNVSFRGDAFKAILKPRPALPNPIPEQKIETESNSPIKQLPEAIYESQFGENSPNSKTNNENIKFEQVSEIDLPSKTKTSSMNKNQNKPYLSQLTRFVLQNDGADKIISKLCADFVNDTEGSFQNTFCEDLYESLKMKFSKMLSSYIQPIYLDEIMEKGDLFKSAFEEYNYNEESSVEKLAEKLLELSQKHRSQLNEINRLNEGIRKNMYDIKKNPKEVQSKLFKMKRVKSSIGEDFDSDNESKAPKSGRTHISGISRFTGRADRKKSENELVGKIYSAMKTINSKLKKDLGSLVETAHKEGDNITKSQQRSLNDYLDSDYTLLLEILFNFGYFYDYSRVRERLLGLVKSFTMDAPSVISPRGDHRSAHYMKLRSLLKHFQEDTMEITKDMCDLLNDLLTRENWGLMSAYELYIIAGDREEFVDTLFVIYKIYSGGNNDDHEDNNNSNLKQTMDSVLFQFRVRFDQKIYDKLVDLIKGGDTKTKEYYDVYKKDRDDKKLVSGLTDYAQEKIKRLEELKKATSTKTKVDPDEWRTELTSFLEAYKDKIKIPEEMDHHEIINNDVTMSKAIYEVYKSSGKDSGDAVENLVLLRNNYIKIHLNMYYSGIPFMSVLLKHRIDPYIIISIISDYNKKKKPDLDDAVTLFYALEDEEDFVDSVMRIYKIKK